MPTGPTDQTKVPHYFSPYPNWALSPLRTTDAKVTITGTGTGATVTAVVDGTGVITGITITSPGSGYAAGATTVDHNGLETGRHGRRCREHDKRRDRHFSHGRRIRLREAHRHDIGGGAATDATATAFGGVDAVQPRQCWQRLCVPDGGLRHA